MLLIDVTPMSLGIATYGDKMSKIIEKCTPVPIQQTERYETVKDN